MEIIKEPCDADVQKSEVNETSGNQHVYPDVANMQQARTVLMNSPFNCTLSKLQNKNSIKAMAQEHDVSFPNWL